LVKGFGVSAIGSFGCGGYALAEPWRTGLTHYRISPPNWPKGLKLRLALIADLHICEPWMGMERVRAVVERTNALEADCVLLLGDYVSGLHMLRLSEYVPHKRWAKALSRLNASHGVYSVLGNHDWWEDVHSTESGAKLPRAGLALQDAGIAVFENSSVRLEKDGFGFWIAGLGDQWAFMNAGRRWRDERGLPLGTDDLSGTLAMVNDDAPVILMAHEPDVFAHMPQRVALTVSGHTHGGQVRVLGYAPYVPSRFGDRYIYGHIVEDDRHLVVSGGLGCSVMPVRFGCPPEIVVVDLSA
jgi:predicted MPP superfamily phosphohydrolase